MTKHIDRRKQRDQYDELTREEFYPVILAMLRDYVDLAIGASAADTVGDEWGVTAMPATNRTRDHRRLTCVSLPNSPETFVIFRTQQESAAGSIEWMTAGFVHVDRATLVRANKVPSLPGLRRKFQQMAPFVEFEAVTGYRDIEDAIRIRFSLVAAPFMDETADGVQWSAAARALAVRLLGRGCVQAHYNNPWLASSVLRVKLSEIQAAAS